MPAGAGWMVLPLSLVIGSFVGVVVRRLPTGRPLGMVRSQCDSCGHVLGAREMVPLLSFAAQRGRCLHCSAKIGWFHPAIELTALAVAVVVLLLAPDNWAIWVYAGLGWALLAAAWIDFEHYTLPDAITLPLLLAGLAVTWLCTPWAIYDHTLAVILGYGGFRLLDMFYLFLRGRHGLGQGDAKLLAAAGAWVGLGTLPMVILVAGLLGIAVALPLAFRDRQGGLTIIPFGPALALAFFSMALLNA